MLNSNNLCVAILATILQLACHGDTLNDGSVATGIGGSVVVRCSGGFVPSGELSVSKCNMFLNYLKVHWLGPRSLLISINGEILYSGHGNKYRINKVHEGNYELVVNDVSESDAGEYECKFVNKQGVTVHSKRVRLNINAVEQCVNINFSNIAPPKIVTPEIHEMKVSEGRSLTLFCNYSGYPEPTVTWKFRAENNQFSRSIATDQSQISLYNVTLKDAGQYECHADNGERPPAFISYTISVTSGPRLHTPYSRIYQKIGHLLHIQCIVTWKPSGRYFWEFQDLKIVTDDSIGATGNDGNNNDDKNVSITPGKYVLSSKIPSSSPPSSSSTSSSSSQLQSNVKYVTSSYSIDEHTTMLGLFIDNLALSDAGFYRCKFQNEYGQSQEAIEGSERHAERGCCTQVSRKEKQRVCHLVELLNGRHLLIHRVSYGDRGYYSCVSYDNKYDTTGDNKDTDVGDGRNDTSDVVDYEDGDTKEKFTWYLSILGGYL
ncbi:hypothetical protein HELRODRAFT_180787 [Helobdella robusta]|uniref:Ig-like domain-containing protein n=1 Tax=Helobdella robusta TaxID=6412 RepID=T1FGA0_HELRO|nr:hypothetical protein HELRODRAFT_180787 [Helobdella robusta]ESN93690.1 hypothetical protein HELRODRAFT_180787 [Helobdella robusta]